MWRRRTSGRHSGSMDFPLPTDRATTAVKRARRRPRLLGRRAVRAPAARRHVGDRVPRPPRPRRHRRDRDRGLRGRRAPAHRRHARRDALERHGHGAPLAAADRGRPLAPVHVHGHEGSKHWWIDALEADTLEGLDDAEPRTVFAGNELDRRQGPAGPALPRRLAGVDLRAPARRRRRRGPHAQRVRDQRATACTGSGTASCSTAARASGTRAAPGSRASCPTAAPPTTAARPRRRTGSSAPA